MSRLNIESTTALPRSAPVLSDYVSISREKIRYRDTDGQGHVNNSVFATYLETGRVEVLLNGGLDLAGPDGGFVLAHLTLDYRKEVKWPGEIEIGTRVVSIGRSSLRFAQAVFCNGECVASGETIVVLTDKKTRRSSPFSDEARAYLESMVRKEPLENELS
jgi:acyl-CoA thioester hydrolase